MNGKTWAVVAIVWLVLILPTKCLEGYDDNHATSTPARPMFSKYEIARSMLKMGEAIGNGAFGVVYQAVLSGRNGGKIVAVKCLKENATSEIKENLLNEIQLIIEIGNHPNILPIVGCLTSSEPYYLVTEFMKYGDLLEFLRKSKKQQQSIIDDDIYCLSEVNKLQIARQIACGMDFLSSTRYYHGDLAARNVLVGECLVVKICDFGMADDIYTMDVMGLSPQKKRAVKWVSLEANLSGQCTIMSDVWSYGIVLYEIETLGDVPYPGMDPHTVLQQLKSGYRMEKPEHCSTEVYEIMRDCWLEDPNVRPTFKDLVRSVDILLAKSSTYLDMDDLVVNPEFEAMPLQTDTPLLHSANEASEHTLHVDVVLEHELHVEAVLDHELHVDTALENDLYETPGDSEFSEQNDTYEMPSNQDTSNVYDEMNVVERKFGSMANSETEFNTYLIPISSTDSMEDKQDNKQLTLNAEVEDVHLELDPDLDQSCCEPLTEGKLASFTTSHRRLLFAKTKKK